MVDYGRMMDEDISRMKEEVRKNIESDFSNMRAEMFLHNNFAMAQFKKELYGK